MWYFQDTLYILQNGRCNNELMLASYGGDVLVAGVYMLAVLGVKV